MASICRLCGSPLQRTFLDLGDMPVANAYLDSAEQAHNERRFPLHAKVCDQCLLVQIDAMVSPAELFSDYAYFSSYSSTWIEHTRRFAQHCTQALGLGSNSLVMEIASNDGHLLRHFADMGIPVLGIDPAANCAAAAMALGIPTEIAFFGENVASELRQKGIQADLLVANNVFAHVPDLNDFTAGFAVALKPTGTLSIEFPHLLQLMQSVAFDTIYHEHFSYFSLLTAERALANHGLEVFDVEELPTHGGSLRLWVGHAAAKRPPSPRLLALRECEAAAGLTDLVAYEGFAPQVEKCCQSLNQFVADVRGEGQTIVGYGAAAKGNTLLNSCGLTANDIPYVLDRSPHKQGKLLPGSHIPIRPPEYVTITRPDYVLVLPWNLRDEILEQMSFVRDWGAQFVLPIPQVEIAA